MGARRAPSGVTDPSAEGSQGVNSGNSVPLAKKWPFQSLAQGAADVAVSPNRSREACRLRPKMLTIDSLATDWCKALRGVRDESEVARCSA